MAAWYNTLMILHLDLDCFFAAAHRINNPHLNNIPIAVGSRSNLSIFEKATQKNILSKVNGAFTSSIVCASETSKTFEEYFLDENKKIRGIITTSSYEARAFGVKTAMSVAQALQLCPGLVVLPPNYPLYHTLSHQLRQLLEKEVPTLEQFSIDEFFCDISGWVEEKELYEFALKLQKKVAKQLGLPVSIGSAQTKWIAKLATNDAKPNGIKIVKKEEVANYIQNKPVGSFCGIGKQYEKKLLQHGITTLGKVKENKKIFESWGKFGKVMYSRILGKDNERVVFKKLPSKSIGLGRSFDPIYERNELKRRAAVLCRHLSFLALKHNYNPTTALLVVRYQYGETTKGSHHSQDILNEQHLKATIAKLFTQIDNHPSHGVIQINITLSNFIKNPNTFNLFTLTKKQKEKQLNNSIQKLREKFGVDIIKGGSEL